VCISFLPLFLLFFQLKFPVGLLWNPPETRLCMIRIRIGILICYLLFPELNDSGSACSKIPGTQGLNSAGALVQSNCNYRKHVVGSSDSWVRGDLRFVTLLIYVELFSQRYSMTQHRSSGFLPYLLGSLSMQLIRFCDRRAFYFFISLGYRYRRAQLSWAWAT